MPMSLTEHSVVCKMLPSEVVFLFFILVPAVVNSEKELWWTNAIIYQIYPRSFKDSNNDGVGDLPGITSKLSYLAELGVNGVWLSPIYPSPMKDFGYDISDFKDIHPEFGTLADFDKLVNTSKSLGMRVIMDFVPNHSSDQHPWFLKSVKREAGYEDYYVWKDPKGMNKDGKPIPPNNWLSLFYGSAWEYNAERRQFYLHQFAAAQPDLNYDNPAVVQEMKDVIMFWLNRGVDGFRIDAIPFLFESPELKDEPLNPLGPEDPNDYDHLNHIYTRDYQGTYDMMRDWRKLIDEQSAKDHIDRCIMVEAYASEEMTMKYYGSEEAPISHFPFNFNFIFINNKTGAAKFRQLINRWLDNLPSHGHSNWLVGNHDNHRIGSRINSELIDAMNVLILSLPGVAVSYYGEEIGMVDNLEISYDDGKDPNGLNHAKKLWLEKSRDFERTPMQWNDSVNAGFNEGTTPWLPIHKNYKHLNVKKQLEDPKSHLNIYKSMAQLKKTPVFRDGRLAVQVDGDILAILSNSPYSSLWLNSHHEDVPSSTNCLINSTRRRRLLRFYNQLLDRNPSVIDIRNIQQFLNSSEYAVVLINFGSVKSKVNLDSIFLLGQNTQLQVVIADKNSSLNLGSKVAAGTVDVGIKSVLVLKS